MRPGNLLLRTSGSSDFDAEHLWYVFMEQRLRFITVLRGFSAADWAAPTRCSEWSAHEVVRHLCDTNMIGLASAPGNPELHLGSDFDPRITPRRLLAASAGEPPDESLRRFEETSVQLSLLARERLAAGISFDVRIPTGELDWTVLMLHGFWDSWIHERDVLLARGAEHLTSADATAYAISYGVFMAAVVAETFGSRLTERLTLGGDGGGVFDLDCRDGVTLSVARASLAGPAAPDVADALAGRGRARDLLDGLPESSVTELTLLADFFNTPVVTGSSPPSPS